MSAALTVQGSFRLPLHALNWRAEDLWLQLEPHARGMRHGLSIEVLPEVASTNTTLVERARAGDTAPCLLVAERQTAGRGRMGRSWQSSADQAGASLTCSLGCLLAPADWSGLSLAVGLALAEALDPMGASIGVKWPNDLWLRGADRKLGGILIETLPLSADALAEIGAPPHARHVVIGFGLNLALVELAAQAADAHAVTGVPPAWLQEIEPALSAPDALHRIAGPLWQALQAFERDGLAPLHTRYAARDALAGRAVQAGALRGVAAGLAADGALQLRDDAGRLHAVHAGDVSVRPC